MNQGTHNTTQLLRHIAYLRNTVQYHRAGLQEKTSLYLTMKKYIMTVLNIFACEADLYILMLDFNISVACSMIALQTLCITTYLTRYSQVSRYPVWVANVHGERVRL